MIRLTNSSCATVARLLCLALLATLAGAIDAAAPDPDARPGARGQEGLQQWTLKGPLGETPTRVNQTAPLSDQANTQRWRRDTGQWDEFDGESLATQRWSSRHRSWRGRPPALFSEKNVDVTDGMLRLWMRKDGASPEAAGDGFHTYTSASVQAKQLSLYGYYEVRAKPMASAGSSSFWFADGNGKWRTEIDVFELGGRALKHESRYNMNLHVFRTPTDRSHRNWGDHWIAPFQFADGFHVFGLDWTPDRITYYVDGVPVRWVENAYWRQPLYLIFDSETMIDWLGEPKEEDLPSVFQIDYVRVWNRPQETVRPTP
ncbi:Beta-porphyranase A precursor [Pirellulimonas nuda]|uniref:Beta-porphyranase A n=1 Tax=Pirellulimonas nuda TaxID=2528009 RepID=A0A518DFL9_9BACT|nr:family 16 glycosylhydrolase [Pirellulimonas nuda]QDU90277.1 Beta-porphyranase A precursor [Pirellulimonas nuda]